MSIRIVQFAPTNVERRREEIVAAYAAAFQTAPYCKSAEEVSSFANALPSAYRRSGFKAVVAVDADKLIGFAYGYPCTPDSHFYQVVSAAMPPQLARQWLINSFQLAEMALLPSHQGCGIGGQLHDSLLTNVPFAKAILATMAADTSASALYRRRGWQLLLPTLAVPSISRPYCVMGKEFVAAERPY